MQGVPVDDAGLDRKNLLLANALHAARVEIERLKADIERLTAPPLTSAVFLTTIDPLKRVIDVSNAGRTMRVFAAENIPLGSLVAGQVLMLDEHLCAVAVGGAEDIGDVVTVEEHVDDAHVVVRVRPDELRVLRVGPNLRGKEIRAGDTMMADLKTAFLISHVAHHQVQDLLLEESPNTPWSDIGGLDELIERIRDAVELPLAHPEIFAAHELTPPKGLLLYGPPGVGKTLIAKAIATSLSQRTGQSAHFINIRGPQLLDKYVGETERRIRTIFARAREKAASGVPVVIFFDEMESLFRTRGSGISSDVETTVVPQLLSEIDGVEALNNVIVIGASNREDMIDPAILRPGRLDLRIRIDRPAKDACQRILAIHLHPRLPLHADEVTTWGSPQAAAQAMGEALLDQLFRRDSTTEVLNVHHRSGKTVTWYLSDLVSGAMLASIVERAKALAVKDAIAGKPGITLEHLMRALNDERGETAEITQSADPHEWSRLVGRHDRLDPIVTMTPATHRGRSHQ